MHNFSAGALFRDVLECVEREVLNWNNTGVSYLRTESSLEFF